jgi:hypothetical protein
MSAAAGARGAAAAPRSGSSAGRSAAILRERRRADQHDARRGVQVVRAGRRAGQTAVGLKGNSPFTKQPGGPAGERGARRDAPTPPSGPWRGLPVRVKRGAGATRYSARPTDARTGKRGGSDRRAPRRSRGRSGRGSVHAPRTAGTAPDGDTAAGRPARRARWASTRSSTTDGRALPVAPGCHARVPAAPAVCDVLSVRFLRG